MSGFAQTRWKRELRGRDERDHFVYLIGRIGDSYELSGPVKVGISKAPLKRMQTLQTGCHDRLVLISRHAFWKRRHAEIVERSFHDAMIHYRLNGEWFDIPPVDAVAAIGVALEGFISSYLQPDDTSESFMAADQLSVPGFGIDLPGIKFEFPQ